MGSGAVWVADPVGGRVWRVEMQPGLEKRAYDVGTWVAGVAVGGGAVWATNEIADLVYRIDPVTDRVVEVTGATSPRDVGAGDGAVWVTAGRPRSSDAALPPAICGETAFDGEGRPDLLIVSDLPLRGEMRDVTRPMVDAIRLVAGQRGYQAGAFWWAIGRAIRPRRNQGSLTSSAAVRTRRRTLETPTSLRSSDRRSPPAPTCRSRSRTPLRAVRLP